MLYIKKHSPDLIDECKLEENQKLLVSVLDYIVDNNMLPQLETFVNPSQKWSDISSTFCSNLSPILASLKDAQEKGQIELEETLKYMINKLIFNFISYRKI